MNREPGTGTASLHAVEMQQAVKPAGRAAAGGEEFSLCCFGWRRKLVRRERESQSQGLGIINSITLQLGGFAFSTSPTQETRHV